MEATLYTQLRRPVEVGRLQETVNNPSVCLIEEFAGATKLEVVVPQNLVFSIAACIAFSLMGHTKSAYPRNLPVALFCRLLCRSILLVLASPIFPIPTKFCSARP